MRNFGDSKTRKCGLYRSDGRKYCLRRNENKGVKIGCTCSKNVEEKKYVKDCGGKPFGNPPLRRPGRKRWNNFKMDVRKTGWSSFRRVLVSATLNVYVQL
jgi:hypothetical protein